MRPNLTRDNRHAGIPVALAVIAVVGALSAIGVPARSAAASAASVVPSAAEHAGVPAGFSPIASTVVPHSSMEYVLGTTAEKTASFRRYEVLRIYHGKTLYSVVARTRNDTITSIAAGSSSQVWLGGQGRHYLNNGDYYAGPFVWRKTGNSWTAAKLPRRTSGDLDSISASSPTNAWAAGYLPSPDNSVADVLHWNGKTWKAVDTGQPPDPTWLSISTSSPTNVWAIQENELTHWNGHVWSLHDPAGANPVSSIATDGRKRVWAVGFRLTGQPGTADAHAAPYAVRLDGSRWVTVREPTLPAWTSLTQVAMRGSSVWAVGTRGTGNSELILHSNGRQLSVVPTRQPGNSSGVGAISAGPKKTALALGSYTTGTKCPKIRYHSLILVVHVRSTRRIDPTVTGSASCSSTAQR